MEALAKFFQRAARRNSAVTAIAAVLSVVVVVSLGRTFIAKAPPISEPRYLTARRELPQGSPVNFLDLTYVFKSEAVSPPTLALTDQDLYLLKGATFRRTMAAKSFLTAEDLIISSNLSGLGAAIPQGLRAYSLKPANRLRVGPGDRLDILVTPVGEAAVAMVVVEGAPVLQVPNRDEFELVVALNSEDIQLLEKAKQKGKLNIALRNPQETSGQTHSNAARLWLKKKVSPVRPKPKIEVWAEDR